MAALPVSLSVCLPETSVNAINHLTVEGVQSTNGDRLHVSSLFPTPMLPLLLFFHIAFYVHHSRQQVLIRFGHHCIDAVDEPSIENRCNFFLSPTCVKLMEILENYCISELLVLIYETSLKYSEIFLFGVIGKYLY